MTPARVLIVAHQTAAGPALLDAVRRRAAAGECTFTLLVPSAPRGLHRVVDPEDHGRDTAEQALSDALPRLWEAAGTPVSGMIGSHEPFAAVQDALNVEGFDEVIVSTLPARISRWLRVDLPSKVAALGVPVTTVTAGEVAAAA